MKTVNHVSTKMAGHSEISVNRVGQLHTTRSLLTPVCAAEIGVPGRAATGELDLEGGRGGKGEEDLPLALEVGVCGFVVLALAGGESTPVSRSNATSCAIAIHRAI